MIKYKNYSNQIIRGRLYTVIKLLKLKEKRYLSMKRFRKTFALALSAVLVLSTGLTTGCGSSASASNNGVKQIVVGTGNGYSPYCYLDDNGNLAGYEYEVLKAVDELLPQYEFTYQTSDFNNVAISLDAGKIDIAAHQYEYNDERASKYLFGTEAYTTYVTYLAVPATNTTIHSLDDLQGKTVFTGSKGSNSTYIVENYNEKHKDNPVKIQNADSVTSEEYVQSLLSGKWDAGIITKRDVDKDNKAYGSVAIKVTGDPIQTSSTYFMFAKGNTELQQAVDGALKQLKESGKLAQISIAVIGGDYTESE
jgi:L-cystine transport system substrate-binding protein